MALAESLCIYIEIKYVLVINIIISLIGISVVIL